jgi:hypothetical protein
MTTSSSPPVVSVSGPGDLVSLVPYLVGFHPSRSLVVLSLHGPRLRCGLTARFDLPHAGTTPEEFATEAVSCVLRDEPSQVALLVYDDQPWVAGERPWQSLVDALEREFTDAEVPVKEAVYVGTDRYWSMTCRSDACCPDGGTPLASVRARTPAASLVLHGRAPLGDRDELVRRVAPRGLVTVSAVASVAERQLARRAALEHAGPHGVLAWFVEVTQLFDEVVRRAGGDVSDAAPGRLSGEEAGLLLAGLLDVGVRDALSGRCTAWLDALPDRRGQAGPANRPTHHEQDPVTSVLRELAVMSDGQLAVAPLTLLAAQYWGAGEGALANAAVERALTIDPDYRLAVLLAQLLRAAIPPAWVQRSQPVPAGRGPGDDSSRLGC